MPCFWSTQSVFVCLSSGKSRSGTTIIVVAKKRFEKYKEFITILCFLDNLSYKNILIINNFKQFLKIIKYARQDAS